MSNTLYLECASGISGDMFVASLVDLGADQTKLKEILASIHAHGAEIVISRVKKSGLDVCDFLVKLDEEHENHDHDMEYLHGHEHEHHHDHEHSHHHEHHEHRGLPEILQMLKNSDLSERAYAYAEKIFRILADAESKAHGVPADQVHFHEVGAIDSILDIAAAAICLDLLDIGTVYVPELTEGSGTVRCQHGILPIPVPAVSNIAAAHALPIQKTSVKGELITPTGAAIAAAIRTDEPLPAHFTIEKIGLGAGKRKYETPGFLRAMLIRENKQREKAVKYDRICKLETDVDDCTGEMLGYVMEQLFDAGAKDVHYTPVFMKKNRPAYEITVICEPDLAQKMEEILFRETTTIGIRRCLMDRTVLERTFETAVTPWGNIGVKVCSLPGGEIKRRYIEFGDAEKVAKKAGIPLPDLYRFVEKK
ncbi:MAG: nickel pincer cofactor biosynthesis protein LarC [Lachnospiraceae bacterium]|nr:nickel pincer cofactor biosynthesis protein LarC [Lachnospiraceae bacterium]